MTTDQLLLNTCMITVFVYILNNVFVIYKMDKYKAIKYKTSDDKSIDDEIDEIFADIKKK